MSFIFAICSDWGTIFAFWPKVDLTDLKVGNFL